MRVTTYEAVVENGQIRFLEAVRLPEHSRVYVVVPGIEEASPYHVRSPRLVHPERAADFTKEVVEELPDAGL
jgi:hypothetical protein